MNVILKRAENKFESRVFQRLFSIYPRVLLKRVETFLNCEHCMRNYKDKSRDSIFCSCSQEFFPWTFSIKRRVNESRLVTCAIPFLPWFFINDLLSNIF